MRGKKVGDQKKEELKAALMVNPEATSPELAKIVHMPERTIRDILPKLKESDDYTEARLHKKEEFIEKAWDLVGKAMLKMKLKLDTMNEEELKKVNIRDLAVAMGTVYDKQALAAGEPTQISDSNMPVDQLIKQYDDKLEQYKRLIKNSNM